MPQRASDGKRYGVSKFEDYLEDCFSELGYRVKRQQIFCFMCNGLWQKLDYNYPSECWNCDAKYSSNSRGLFCMPDLVIETIHAHNGIVFVQDWRHDTHRGKIKDKYQIEKLKEAGYLTFIIYNEEIAYMKHANRCFLMLGYIAALQNPEMYSRAFRLEKELPK